MSVNYKSLVGSQKYLSVVDFNFIKILLECTEIGFPVKISSISR